MSLAELRTNPKKCVDLDKKLPHLFFLVGLGLQRGDGIDDHPFRPCVLNGADKII